MQHQDLVSHTTWNTERWKHKTTQRSFNIMCFSSFGATGMQLTAGPSFSSSTPVRMIWRLQAGHASLTFRRSVGASPAPRPVLAAFSVMTPKMDGPVQLFVYISYGCLQRGGRDDRACHTIANALVSSGAARRATMPSPNVPQEAPVAVLLHARQRHISCSLHFHVQPNCEVGDCCPLDFV